LIGMKRTVEKIERTLQIIASVMVVLFASLSLFDCAEIITTAIINHGGFVSGEHISTVSYNNIFPATATICLFELVFIWIRKSNFGCAAAFLNIVCLYGYRLFLWASIAVLGGYGGLAGSRLEITDMGEIVAYLAWANLLIQMIAALITKKSKKRDLPVTEKTDSIAK